MTWPITRPLTFWQPAAMSPPAIGAALARSSRASTPSALPSQAAEDGRAEPHTPAEAETAGTARNAPRGPAVHGDWCVCGIYVVSHVPEFRRIAISLNGDMVDCLEGEATGDLYAHILSLKSQGARSIFLDGVMMARRVTSGEEATG
jgi:hypothetical protein